MFLLTYCDSCADPSWSLPQYALFPFSIVTNIKIHLFLIPSSLSFPASGENNNPDHFSDTLTVIHHKLQIHQLVLLIARGRKSFRLPVMAHCSTKCLSCMKKCKLFLHLLLRAHWRTTRVEKSLHFPSSITKLPFSWPTVNKEIHILVPLLVVVLICTNTKHLQHLVTDVHL